MDTFQQEAWIQLNNNPKQTVSKVVEVNGKTIVRVAMADTMVSDACVSCHNSHPDTPKNDWKLGDVRGVLEVTQPLDKQIANGNALSYKITIILFVIMVLIAVYLANR